jgi:hypothetical protein
MAFMGKLARAGMFGVGGALAGQVLKKDKKKDDKPKPSLTTGDYNTNTGGAGSSLVNQKSIY